jgi:ubiquinone/menaquinone biosynthesis C-methylase UbiE
MLNFHEEMDHSKWEEVFSRQQNRANLLSGWLTGLQLQKGSYVFDLGSGPGYFSLELARHVGPTGMVYAIDQAEGAIQYLKQLLQQQKVRNVIPVISDIQAYTPIEPVSAALLTMVLHHEENPIRLLQKLASFLVPNGRAVIAEFHPDGPILGGPPQEHRIAPEQLSQWLASTDLTEAGYERQSDEHYMLTVAHMR